MSARAASANQPLPVSLALQVVVLLVCAALPLALAAAGGGLVARWTVPNTRPSFSSLSVLPLTSAALLAELNPSLATVSRPVVPAPPDASAPPASSPAPTSAPVPPAPASPAPASTLAAGATALVANTDSSCANVRSAAGLSAAVLQCLPAGTSVHVLAGPTEADGYRWWNVDAGGWIAESFLTVTPATPVASVPPAAVAPAATAAAPAGQSVGGYSGFATYYGIEDGFVRGDIMYDGTPFDPANPTIAAGSFLIPLHTWLLVCSTARCIVVQVRDRGLLDQNGVLLDLSRAAYASLFGGLGGKQHITALFIDPGIVALFPSLSAAAAAP